MLSILALSNRAKTGAAPPEDTAAMMGERSIMAGKMKLHKLGIINHINKNILFLSCFGNQLIGFFIICSRYNQSEATQISRGKGFLQ